MTAPAYETAEAAEAAFYAALENADLEAMMAVWDEAEDIVCIHPLGPQLVGRAAIRKSWAEIFANAPVMRFQVTGRQSIADAALAVHVVDESIAVAGAREGPPVIATNVYRLTGGGWRLVLHHASPPPRPREAGAAPERILH